MSAEALTAEEILDRYGSTLGYWAKAACCKAPIVTYDEALSEIKLEFVKVYRRWTPERGSLRTYARPRCMGAVQDYCRLISFFSSRTKKVERHQLSDHMAAPPYLGETDELWGVIKSVLSRTPKLYLVLCLRFRAGWSCQMIAKYFSVSGAAVSQWFRRGRLIMGKSTLLRRYMNGQVSPWQQEGKALVRRHRFDIPNMGTCASLECNRPSFRLGKCTRCLAKDRTRERRNAQIMSPKGSLSFQCMYCGEPAGPGKKCKRHYGRDWVREKRASIRSRPRNESLV